jgi:hypothetical protein
VSINGTIPSLSIFDSWAKGLVPIPQGAVQVEQDCLNHRSSVYGVDDDATKRENTHRRSAPARCSGLSESPLTRVEHQAIYGELHVNVGESGVRQRLLLLLFGHVERDASR